jgi:hypothetical protein
MSLSSPPFSQFIQIWQTARHHDGTWQPDYVLVGSDVQRGFPSVDCAGVASELHVVTVDGVNDGGPIKHTVRHANGVWQATLGLVGGEFTAVSCAGVGNELQVVGLSRTGRLRHTIRHADATWQPAFGSIESQEHNDPGSFSAVGCAGVGSDLHVVGVVSGELWHTIRHAAGTWQPTFGLIESHEANNPPPFTFVGCAGVQGELHVVGIDADGQLWHTIRRANGSWQSRFGSVEGQESNDPGAFAQVRCAGVGGDFTSAPWCALLWPSSEGRS